MTSNRWCEISFETGAKNQDDRVTEIERNQPQPNGQQKNLIKTTDDEGGPWWGEEGEAGDGGSTEGFFPFKIIIVFLP